MLSDFFSVPTRYRGAVIVNRGSSLICLPITAFVVNLIVSACSGNDFVSTALAGGNTVIRGRKGRSIV